MSQVSNGLEQHTQHAVVCHNRIQLVSLQCTANIWSR